MVSFCIVLGTKNCNHGNYLDYLYRDICVCKDSDKSSWTNHLVRLHLAEVDHEVQEEVQYFAFQEDQK